MELTDSIKEVGSDLWKNKPLAITVAVGLVIVVFLIIKHNKAGLIAPDATPTSDTAGNFNTPLMPQIYINTPGISVPAPGVTISPSQPAKYMPPATDTPVAKRQTVFPAPKGSLSTVQHGAGKGDTHWHAYEIKKGDTLKSISSKVSYAHPHDLSLFRNNRQILWNMGVDPTQFNMPLLPGWVISI